MGEARGVRCVTCGWAANARPGPDGYALTVLAHLMFNEDHQLVWPEDVREAAEITERAAAVADGYRRGFRAGRSEAWTVVAHVIAAAEKR